MMVMATVGLYRATELYGHCHLNWSDVTHLRDNIHVLVLHQLDLSADSGFAEQFQIRNDNWHATHRPVFIVSGT